jgi:hypothetical protein
MGWRWRLQAPDISGIDLSRRAVPLTNFVANFVENFVANFLEPNLAYPAYPHVNNFLLRAAKE